MHLTQKKARELARGAVSTEHLLLALVEFGEPIASLVAAAGASPEKVRAEVLRRVSLSSEEGPPTKLTPRLKRVLELSLLEAREMGEDLARPEHLLLGLLREGDGIAGLALARLGVNLESTRSLVLEQEGAAKERWVLTDQVSFMGGSCIRTHFLLAMLGSPDEPGGQILRAQCTDVGALQWHLWNEIVMAARAIRLRQEPGMLDRLLSNAATEAKGRPLQSHHLLLALFREGSTAYRDLLELYGVTEDATRELAEQHDEF